MSTSELINIGFSKFGEFLIKENEFIIDIHDHSLKELNKCVYAFTRGEEILRIGSSKSPLKKRMNASQRAVSRALQLKKSHTSLSEAEKWREKLSKDVGVIYVKL